MNNILLTADHREQLITLAKEKIECPNEYELMEYKRDKMLRILDNELSIKYSPIVLQVLEDFDLLTTIREVSVVFGTSNDSGRYFPYSAETIRTIDKVIFPKQLDHYSIKSVIP